MAFARTPETGWRAVGVCLGLRPSDSSLRRVWNVLDANEPTGPPLGNHISGAAMLAELDAHLASRLSAGAALFILTLDHLAIVAVVMVVVDVAVRRERLGGVGMVRGYFHGRFSLVSRPAPYPDEKRRESNLSRALSTASSWRHVRQVGDPQEFPRSDAGFVGESIEFQLSVLFADGLEHGHWQILRGFGL